MSYDCAECNEPIVGAVVERRGDAYHPECAPKRAKRREEFPRFRGFRDVFSRDK